MRNLRNSARIFKLRESKPARNRTKLIEDTKDSMTKLAAGGLRLATKKVRMQRKKRRACMGFTSDLRKRDIFNYIGFNCSGQDCKLEICFVYIDERMCGWMMK